MTESSLTIYLSLTSSPSSPRAEITIPNGGSSSSTTTPAELRKKASEATSVPLDKLKLIFRGRMIPDKDAGDVVTEMKLEEGCVVHVMGKPVNAAGGSGAASGTPASNGVANVTSAVAGASLSPPSSSNATAAGAAVGGGDSSPLNAALMKLRASNDGATYRTALTTADKLLGNIVSHPMEEKYRTIKKANPAFSKRLGSLPGGSDLLLASGFTLENRENVEYFVLVPSAEKWPKLVESQKEVKRVLAEANSGNVGGAPPPVAAPAAGGMPGGGMPNLFPGGMPGAGGIPGAGPDMSMMQSMMNDPNMMQNALSMMNNPMVQNMMRNDPRFANNPMLQQSLDALQRNPEMLNQVSQMMSDPNMRQRMESMMGNMGGGAGGMGGAGGATGAAADPFAGGPEAMRRQMEMFQQMSQQFGGSSGGSGAGGGGGTAPPPNAPSGTSQTNSGAGGGSDNNNNAGSRGGNDTEMTEEEMIAEAIARSLRES